MSLGVAAASSRPDLYSSLSLPLSIDHRSRFSAILQELGTAEEAVQSDALRVGNGPRAEWLPEKWPKRFPEVRDSDGYISPSEYASSWLYSVREDLKRARLDLSGVQAEQLPPTLFEVDLLSKRIGSARYGLDYLAALSAAATGEGLAAPAPDALRLAAKSLEEVSSGLSSLVPDGQVSSAYVTLSRELKRLRFIFGRAVNLIPCDALHGSARREWHELAEGLQQWRWDVQKVGEAGQMLARIDDLHLALAQLSAKARTLGDSGLPIAELLDQGKAHLPPFMERSRWHISGDWMSGDTWDLTTSPHYCSLHWCNNLIGGSSSSNVIWEKHHGLVAVALNRDGGLMPVVQKELFDWVRETCFKDKAGRDLEGLLLTSTHGPHTILNIPFRSATAN